MLRLNNALEIRSYYYQILALFAYLAVSPCVMVSNGQAADLSELMEKALYAEESVGDLNEAIKVYEQVVAEGEAANELAARAQYRIGECYAKQGKQEEANLAFQSVIDNYPDSKSMVAMAKRRLPKALELLPIPWGDGDEMVYEFFLPTGMGIGHHVNRIYQTELEGRPVWKCNAWQTITLNDMSGKSEVYCDRESFAPIKSQWRHTMLGESLGTYDENQVQITMVNRQDPVKIEFDSPVYDNEQAAELFRRLPLKVGYKATIDIIPILTGTKLPLEVEVPRMETIEVPAGKFECYVVKLHIGQTFWVSNDENRYIARFEAGGVIANLTEAYRYVANQTKKINKERFSVELPPNWYVYSPTNPQDRSYDQMTLIDPDGKIDAYLNSRPIAKIKEKFDTLEAWTEDAIKKHEKQKQGFKLSDKGIESIDLAGRKACQIVFESKKNDKAMKERMIVCFGSDSAVNLRFTIAADEFDEAQSSIDQILSSLIVK